MCGGWQWWCLEASKDSRTRLQLPHCLQIVNWRTDEDLAVSSGGCSSVFDCQEPVSLSESEEDWELLNILLHFRHYTLKTLGVKLGQCTALHSTLLY